MTVPGPAAGDEAPVAACPDFRASCPLNPQRRETGAPQGRSAAVGAYPASAAVLVPSRNG